MKDRVRSPVRFKNLGSSIVGREDEKSLRYLWFPASRGEFVKALSSRWGYRNEHPSVLGVMQIEIKGRPLEESIYSLEIKREWQEKVRYHCPPLIDQPLIKKVEEVALRSYRALDCRDVSRVDIRVGEDHTPYFLEINPLPGLSPVYGDLVIMARSMGWDYARLVKTIFHQALKRYGWM
jgi:D-alanine-D-alanine ligase